MQELRHDRRMARYIIQKGLDFVFRKRRERQRDMVGRAPRPLHLRSQSLPLPAHGNDRAASGIHPPARQTVRMVCLLKRFQPLASPPGIAILQFHRLFLASVRFSLLYEIVTVQAIGCDGFRREGRDGTAHQIRNAAGMKTGMSGW